MSVKYLMISVLVFIVFSNRALANTMDDFPVPSQTQVWWIANGTVHNGYKVFIKKFKSRKSLNDIAEFYKHTWQSKNDLPGYMENKTDGWQLISRLASEYQWVVQIRASESGRGSEGILSAMKLTSTGTSHSSRVLRQSRFTDAVQGGDLLSTTEANEPVLARTQLHLYHDSPSRVANRFKTHMASVGWSLQDEFLHRGAVIQRFDKSKRKIDVALVEHSGKKTLLYLNEVVSGEN